MRQLRSVQESERVSSIPGLYAMTRYRLKSPNRLAYRTNGQVQTVSIGGKEWDRPSPRDRWQQRKFGGGLPFQTRSWFTWTTYAQQTYLLGYHTEAGRRVAEVGLMDAGTPTWWRLSIDLRSHRVLHDRLITNGHFMSQRFFGFDQPVSIHPPLRAHA